jgi:hypothetical protein
MKSVKGCLLSIFATATLFSCSSRSENSITSEQSRSKRIADAFAGVGMDTIRATTVPLRGHVVNDDFKDYFLEETSYLLRSKADSNAIFLGDYIEKQKGSVCLPGVRHITRISP